MLPEEDIFIIRQFNNETHNSLAEEIILSLSKRNLSFIKNKVTYIEVHGVGRPAPFEIPYAALRANIRANNGNIFFFTTLRNPVYFIPSMQRYWCEQLRVDRLYCNIDAIRKHFVNPQLKYYLGFMPAMIGEKNDFVSNLQEVQVRSALLSLDYVGFQEDLRYTFQKIENFIISSVPVFNTSVMRYIPLANKQYGQNYMIPLKLLKETQQLDMQLYEYFANYNNRKEVLEKYYRSVLKVNNSRENSRISTVMDNKNSKSLTNILNDTHVIDLPFTNQGSRRYLFSKNIGTLEKIPQPSEYFVSIVILLFGIVLIVLITSYRK
jgi:hypothetical protein